MKLFVGESSRAPQPLRPLRTQELVEIFRASRERFLKGPVDSAALRALLIKRDAHTFPGGGT